jgi:hypothetical protein
MGWVAVTPRTLYPLQRDPIPTVEEAGWAPGPVWTVTENLSPPGFETRTTRDVTSRHRQTSWWYNERHSYCRMKINSLPRRKYTGPSSDPQPVQKYSTAVRNVNILYFAHTVLSLASYNFQKKQRLFSWTVRTQWPLKRTECFWEVRAQSLKQSLQEFRVSKV